MDERQFVGQYPAGNADYMVEFKDVNFSYNGGENNLENINFALKKGGTLGIIGATGSGKSTIVNLLMRFYDVSSGAVYVGETTCARCRQKSSVRDSAWRSVTTF